MPQYELPSWIEVLMKRGLFSCSQPEHVHFRQDFLRRQVLEIADAREDGRKQLHDACIQLLANPDNKLVKGALSGLFVIGTVADASAVKGLLQHPNDSVQKAARTCLFEIQSRPEKIKPT